jgi:hypothetical protein
VRTTSDDMSRLALMLTLIFASSAGCASHFLRGGIYRGERTSYRLGPLGPAWQRHDSEADLSFFAPELDAVIMVNAECPAEHDPPLPVAANTLLIGFTDRQIVHEESVPLAGRQALHRRVRARLDGVPLAIDTFVLKKDDCLYDFVYLSPPESAARGVPDFERVVSGFDTVGGERTARRAAVSQ